MATLQDLKKNARARTLASPDAALAATAAPVDSVKIKLELMEERVGKLSAAAAIGVNVHAEIQNALNLAGQNLSIRDSTPESFYEAVRVAVSSGLGLSDGYGFLSAGGHECSFVPGWKGLVELVLRSERGTVWTGIVRKGDDFDYQLGDRPSLTQRPGDRDDHKSITYYYACGRIKGSDTPIIEVWSVAKLMRHFNKYNNLGGAHYALKSDEAMESYGRKIALLQVLKYMPRSKHLEIALAADAAQFMHAPQVDQAPAPAIAAPVDAASTPPTARPRTKAPAAKKPAAKKPAAKPVAKRAATKPAAATKKATPAKKPTTFNME